MSPASPTIVIELLHQDAFVPCRATEESVGYDLCAYLRGRRVACSDGTQRWELGASGAEHENPWLEIAPGVTALVPLGFKAALPAGYEAQIRPRSGTTFKKGLLVPNAPGTIDADFPDEWMVLLRNGAPLPTRIEHGERIAQMVLHRYEVLPFERGRVGVSTSRVGGFGSTGR